MINVCGTCIYWHHGNDAGECRRHPPVVLNKTPNFMGADLRACCIWPVTASDDWCGDWIGPSGEASQ